MPRFERKYQLTKLEAGDYLLPGNNEQSLFRIVQTAEPHTWDVYRYLDRFGKGVHLSLDDLEWGHWECVEQCLATRAEAIQEALRLSQP